MRASVLSLPSFSLLTTPNSYKQPRLINSDVAAGLNLLGVVWLLAMPLVLEIIMGGVLFYVLRLLLSVVRECVRFSYLYSTPLKMWVVRLQLLASSADLNRTDRLTDWRTDAECNAQRGLLCEGRRWKLETSSYRRIMRPSTFELEIGTLVSLFLTW